MAFWVKSLSNPEESKWAVKKDKGVFDQFTGATITPRAVTNAVHKALQYYDANKAQIINAVATNTSEQQVNTDAGTQP